MGATGTERTGGWARHAYRWASTTQAEGTRRPLAGAGAAGSERDDDGGERTRIAASPRLGDRLREEYGSGMYMRAALRRLGRVTVGDGLTRQKGSSPLLR